MIILYVSRAQNRLGLIEASATLEVKQKTKPLELTMIPHDMTAPKGIIHKPRGQLRGRG